MKKLKNLIIMLLTISILGLMCGCDTETSSNSNISDNKDDVDLNFYAYFYDNNGNNYVTFKGKNFNITPNKTKQWGYNTEGYWTSWYEMSSVVTVEIDGNYVNSCGSTIIFKDQRIKIDQMNVDYGTLSSSDKSGYASLSSKDNKFLNYFSLTSWWFDTHEKGQGGSKIILIQSQDGYNIGVVEGNNVKWEVVEKLPKTTLITVDEKAMYLHRCNFTIIDTKLFDNVVLE